MVPDGFCSNFFRKTGMGAILSRKVEGDDSLILSRATLNYSITLLLANVSQIIHHLNGLIKILNKGQKVGGGGQNKICPTGVKK